MADLTSEHIQETISALGDRARKAEARAEQAEATLKELGEWARGQQEKAERANDGMNTYAAGGSSLDPGQSRRYAANLIEAGAYRSVADRIDSLRGSDNG